MAYASGHRPWLPVMDWIFMYVLLHFSLVTTAFSIRLLALGSWINGAAHVNEMRDT